MGKSKVYLNSKIILFIFAILIALACSKKLSAAETATFAISNVTIGQKNATVTKNTKDDSVYTAQVDERSISDGYIISGKADADAQISATDFEGKEFSVKRNGTDFNIEKEETKSYNINGTSVCYITVKKGTVSEKYKVLISGLSNWDNIKETYIADTTNDEINYFDNDTVIQGSSSADTSYREVTVKDEVKQCSVFRWTNHKKTESYSANAMEWLSNGENYVRINGENFQRFESSASYSDTFQSPVLSLKKGLNVIEMYTAEWNVSALDTASETMPEGLKKTNLKGYSCAVYLVYSNGTEAGVKKGSDTDIKYVEATQLGSATVKSTSYGVKNNNGQWAIAIPKKLPLDKIILGIVPVDPQAKIEYMDTQAIKGDQVGMYAAIAVGDSLDKITVKVTAANGTIKTYTISIVRASADCDLKQIELKNAILKDYNTKKETGFSSEKTVYLLQPTDVENAELIIKEISSEAVANINKKKIQSVTINVDDFLAEVKITAQDGINSEKYYFIYQNEDGSVPMFKNSSENEEEVKKAKELLQPYLGQSRLKLKNMWDNSCWSVFMNMAADVNVDEGYVHSPEKENYTQATVYARQILQLVMLGYNPYDFGDSHMNLVEGLLSFKNKEGLFGGYANNEWALMALKVCGEEIPDALVDYVKKVDLYNSQSVDMRGWALAELKGLIPDEEYIAGIIALKDAQTEDGTWGNINTTGCVITGFVGAGVNMDYLKYNGKGILDICQEKNYQEAIAEAVKKNDGVTLKDIVIAMGDVIQGSNVWQRYDLDESKWDKLISDAEDIYKQQPDSDLKNILEKANKIKEEKEYTGNGQTYYSLYERVSEKDNSKKKKVYFESPKISEPEIGKHYAITEFPNSVNNPTHGWYNRVRFMVRDKKLTPENTQGALQIVDSPDVDYSQYTYAAMKGNNIASKSVVYRNKYQDKVYILLLISNTVIQGDEVNKRTADALVEYGPVKADNVKPELYLGNDNENLENNTTLLLKPDNKEIYVKGKDATSGICNILYQSDDGEWTTVYDAAKDDNIDVDNKCGLSEKNIKIPVDEKASVMHVKVIDVAGNETISTVKIVKKSQFGIEPKTIIGNDADFTLNLKLNGNTIASVMNGEDTLEDTSYEVDSEKETLTLKKEYLEKLNAGEYSITIKFSNDGRLLDSDLETALNIDSPDNQIKKLTDMVEALGDITLDKESNVEIVQTFYNNMSEELQLKISDEIKKKISDASDKISGLKEDKSKAQKWEEKVKAIGNVDLSKEELIKEARKTYESLTDSQKSFVTKEVLTVLQNAEVTLQKLKEANNDQKPSNETTVQKLQIQIKKQTTTSITLKWNKISVADGYQLRRYDKSKKKYVVVTDLKKNQNTYTFKKLKGKKGRSLVDGTVYKLNLRSYSMENGKRIYKQTEVITAVTSPMKTSLKVDGVSRNKIKISWKKIRRTTGYKIYVKEGKKSKYRLVKQVNKSNKTKIVISGLKKGKTYFVKVYSYKKAANLNVLSKKSNVKKVRIK